MSQAKELLGKSVYYFKYPPEIGEPWFAQIIRLHDGGTVTLMVPDLETHSVLFQKGIIHSYEPKTHCWMEIEDYEELAWTRHV